MDCLWRSSNKPPREAIIRHETIQQIEQNTEILANKQSRIRTLNSHNNSTVRIQKIIRNKQELVGSQWQCGWKQKPIIYRRFSLAFPMGFPHVVLNSMIAKSTCSAVKSQWMPPSVMKIPHEIQVFTAFYPHQIPLFQWQTPWNPMKSHEIPWNPMKSHEIPWNPPIFKPSRLRPFP